MLTKDWVKVCALTFLRLSRSLGLFGLLRLTSSLPLGSSGAGVLGCLSLCLSGGLLARSRICLRLSSLRLASLGIRLRLGSLLRPLLFRALLRLGSLLRGLGSGLGLLLLNLCQAR